MNTLFFRYAVEVERAASITKAAENLYMAQPNLSKAIKELEDTLGYAIFDRTQRGIIPTKLGADFLVYAKRIVEQLEELKMLGEPNRKDIQEFRVSIPRGSYIANGFMKFLSELDMNQDMDVALWETNSMEAIDNVYNKKCNVAVIRFQSIYENYFLEYLKNKDMKFESIWEFEHLIVMSEKHPLMDVSKIQLEDLHRYIEILHGDTEIPYIRSSDFSGDQMQKKRIYIHERGSQFDLLTTVNTSYMWVSPIPERYLKQYGLVQRTCKLDNNLYKDVLIYRKDYHFCVYDKLFQQKLHEAQEEVSSQSFK